MQRGYEKITNFDQYLALSRNWCKIEPQLLWKANKYTYLRCTVRQYAILLLAFVDRIGNTTKHTANQGLNAMALSLYMLINMLIMQIMQIVSFICLSPSCTYRPLGCWRSNAIVLAAVAAALLDHADHGCIRCSLPVKFTLAAGAYTWRPSTRHTCLYPQHRRSQAKRNRQRSMLLVKNTKYSCCCYAKRVEWLNSNISKQLHQLLVYCVYRQTSSLIFLSAALFLMLGELHMSLRFIKRACLPLLRTTGLFL